MNYQNNMNNELYSELSKKTKSYLEKARIEAEKSKFTYRHGAVLVRGGHIISSAFNENRFCSFGARFRTEDGIATHHAELRCILGLDRSMTTGATVYVVRISNSGEFKMSKPCQMCRDSMRFVGVKRVIYTTNNGIEMLKL